MIVVLVFESVQPTMKEASVVLTQAGELSVMVEGVQAVVCELNGLEAMGAPDAPNELIGVRTHVTFAPVGTEAGPPLEILTPPVAKVAGAEIGMGLPLQTRVAELMLVPPQVTVVEVPRLSTQGPPTRTKLALAEDVDGTQIFAADPPKQP